jgi:2,3,4,5-tetrahydropyridine-2-carboxylate N-succinyltransferase
MKNIYGFGFGIGTKNSNDEWLEVFFPSPKVNLTLSQSNLFRSLLGRGTFDLELTKTKHNKLFKELSEARLDDIAQSLWALKDMGGTLLVTVLAEDQAPKSVPQAYLKLQLLSHRLVKPNETNLKGIFGLLKNIAWTDIGPIDITELPAKMLEARKNGKMITVHSVDKFPKMTDYVIPSGARIADASRVRLGAYIGAGTTIMHEGFVNFNAGTEGAAMIEGRISAGVFCGEGSDIGGGASTMGTLSGGGDVVISIGRNCLLGANSGLGIPLGDRCTIEAGLYVTAGTVVTLMNDDGGENIKLKARELAFKNDLLFRRNSTNGRVECLRNKKAIDLNEELHKSN